MGVESGGAGSPKQRRYMAGDMAEAPPFAKITLKRNARIKLS
jgi:hypothetical protein